jgi:hypothetical protein
MAIIASAPITETRREGSMTSAALPRLRRGWADPPVHPARAVLC